MIGPGQIIVCYVVQVERACWMTSQNYDGNECFAVFLIVSIESFDEHRCELVTDRGILYVYHEDVEFAVVF